MKQERRLLFFLLSQSIASRPNAKAIDLVAMYLCQVGRLPCIMAPNFWGQTHIIISVITETNTVNGYED